MKIKPNTSTTQLIANHRAKRLRFRRQVKPGRRGCASFGVRREGRHPGTHNTEDHTMKIENIVKAQALAEIRDLLIQQAGLVKRNPGSVHVRVSVNPPPLATLDTALGTMGATALTGLAAMIGALFILDDPIFNGLAISLIFGILVSTLLTLVVIPVLYYSAFHKEHQS